MVQVMILLDEARQVNIIFREEKAGLIKPFDANYSFLQLRNHREAPLAIKNKIM